MALFEGTVYSRLVDDPTGEFWTNVYVVDSSNTVTALDDMETIAGFHADVMYDLAEVYKVSARQYPLGGAGLQRDLALAGAVTPVSGVLLPQWNVAKVTFTSLGGRPEVKYLRLPLLVESISGQNLTNGVITSLTLSYASPLEAFAPYVGPSGEAHTGSSVQSRIQMRQTDWSRRFRPGFHRGWVPD